MKITSDDKERHICMVSSDLQFFFHIKTQNHIDSFFRELFLFEFITCLFLSCHIRL